MRQLRFKISVLGVIVLTIASLLITSGSSWASSPGTVPFGFFRSLAVSLFSALSGRPTSATNAFLTNTPTTYSGVDGAFFNPYGVALDMTNQNLYVADTLNHRVVKMSSSTGAFIGAIGKTSATTGTCPASGAASGWCTGGTFVSGTTDGAFNSPKALTLDLTNNTIFVADTSNQRIVKINLATGAFIGAIGKTTASSGTCPAAATTTGWCTGGTFTSGTADTNFSGPLSIAADSTNGFIFVADTGNTRIQKINSYTGVFVGSIGYSSGTSGTCPGAGVSPSWCTKGTFTSSTLDGGYQTPIGIAVDVTNNLMYVADNASQRISKITLSTGAFVGNVGKTSATSGTCPASGATTTWCTGGTFTFGSTTGAYQGPTGVAVDPTGGFMYVADSTNNRIVKASLATGVFSGSIGISTATTGTCPALGVATGWCTNGTFSSNTGGGDGMFWSPYSMALDTAHDALFVADTTNKRIAKITLSTGAWVGEAGIQSGALNAWSTGQTSVPGVYDGMMTNPYDVAVDATNGFVYITDMQNNRILKINQSTGAFVGAIGVTVKSVGTCPSSGATTGWCTGGLFIASSADGGFNAPDGIAIDIAGDALFVADSGNARVEKFTLSTGAFVGSSGMTSGTAGTCPASGKTTSWCTKGTFSSTLGDGSFSSPAGLAIDTTNGFLFVADFNHRRIVKLTLSTGAFVGAVGSLSAGSTGTCSSSGVASTWCTGGQFTATTIDGGYFNPTGLAVDVTHGFLFIADQGSHRIIKTTLSSGAFVGAIGMTGGVSSGTCPSGTVATAWCTGGSFNTTGSGNGMFNYPNRIAVNTTTQIIYVTDNSNHRVQKINSNTGAFVGAIGYASSSTGTCVAASTQSNWCTSGVFSASTADGGFTFPYGIATDGTYLYIIDKGNVRLVRTTLK